MRGGLLELLGMACRNGTRMMIVVGSAEGDLGKDDAGQSVHQAQVLHQDVERRDRDRYREHQTGGEQRVHRATRPELVAGEHVARHHAEHDDAGRGRRRARSSSWPTCRQNVVLCRTSA